MHRRWSIVTLCFAVAMTLSLQAMVGAAMAASAHAAGMSSSMSDGCTGCDDAKADGRCAMSLCASVVAVLADAPQVGPRPRASAVAAADRGATGRVADPDPLPPRS